MSLVVSDRRFFKIAFGKPTYATNWNSMNNFVRGTPRDHCCEVWSKSNEWREVVWMKKLMHAHTEEWWTKNSHKSSRWANKRVTKYIIFLAWQVLKKAKFSHGVLLEVTLQVHRIQLHCNVITLRMQKKDFICFESLIYLAFKGGIRYFGPKLIFSNNKHC